MTHQIRDRLRASPFVFGLIGRRGEHADFDRRVVRAGDDVVIEGYPRSGNTFATMAFRMAQPAPLNIGNHFHAPAQVLRARRFGIPAMVVLRDPAEASLSFVVYHEGKVSALRAVEQYIAFHRPLVKNSDAFVVAPFEEIISDFGKSIARLNTYFRTDFSSFQADEANTADVWAAINAKRAKRLAAVGKSTTGLASMTTPTPEKKALKENFRHAFEVPAVKAALAEARDLHQAFLAHPSLKGKAR